MALAACTMVTGCLNDGQGPKSFLDPSEVGRHDPAPLVVPILDELVVGMEEKDTRFSNASAPTAEDLEVTREDYRIGRNDLVSVSIEGLVGQGVETVSTKRVTESGNINLPLVGTVKALDLTEAELEQAVVQAYRNANLIQDAQVSVTVAEARARTFSVLGSVQQPGQYAILNADFRLLDALVLARGVQGTTVKEVYVIRQVTNDDQNGDNVAPATDSPDAGSLAPQSRANGSRVLLMQADAPAEEAAPVEAEAAPAEAEAAPAVPEEGIILLDDREVPADNAEVAPAEAAPLVTPTEEAAAPAPDAAAPAPVATSAFEFNEVHEPDNVRVIRIPLDKLQKGQLRYNIVIRPNDLIYLPTPESGVVYMGGHVRRVGVYDVTYQDVTLTRAIVMAGMLDSLAIPSRTEIIRKLGPDRQVFVKVDLAKIYAGEDPDILLKPDDVVNVGTNALAPFLAAIRGGFRMTYGFGFLYDRNFYDDPDDDR